MISRKTSPSENMRHAISYRHRAVVPAVLFLHLSAANAQSGAPFDVDWNTIDTGSVTSASGGPFTLSGSVGQPDASTTAGGPFMLDGGFPPGVSFAAAVQTPTPECAAHATELLPAWSLFRCASRDAYREALGFDDATWARGRGLALSTSIVALPYYNDTIPVRARLAKAVIREVLADQEGDSRARDTSDPGTQQS